LFTTSLHQSVHGDLPYLNSLVAKDPRLPQKPLVTTIISSAVDGVSGQSLFPYQWGSGAQTKMQWATAGWNIRFAASLSSVQMLLFPFSIMVLRCVVVLVSSGLRLVMLAMVIGSRFHHNINGHIATAN
jgi:hypothetical protein